MDRPAPCPPARTEAGFDQFGPVNPDRPIILSVPHAGRDYPPELLAQARVRRQQLQRLEDRWADLLVHPLIARGFTVVLARAPRALIDLNRHEREIDPAMLVGAPRDAAFQSSVKLRGGLGLFPRRMVGAHELWHKPVAWSEAQRRIETIHRPYHAELTRLMRAARDAFGHAILIDLHSMPPLPPPAATFSSATTGDFSSTRKGPVSARWTGIPSSRAYYSRAGDGNPARGSMMIRAFMLGLLASLFFAITFVLNRQMDLVGGHWIWSASLRFFFMMPMLSVLVIPGKRFVRVFAEIRRNPSGWLLWSSVGFGVFYSFICMASAYGPSWLMAAAWQVTIVAGALMSPLFFVDAAMAVSGPAMDFPASSWPFRL